jgi:AraC-like DNA-binding protein
LSGKYQTDQRGTQSCQRNAAKGVSRRDVIQTKQHTRHFEMSIATAELIEQPNFAVARVSATAFGTIQHDAQAGDEPRSNDRDSPILATVLVKLLKSAHQAVAADGSEARQYIARATALIKAEVDRREAAEVSSQVELPHSHLAPWQTRRALEFVEANLDDTIRIDDLAAVTRLSASYFSKAFRLDFGESPYAYIVRRRIERAQEMMLLTDDPLASIAIACGLADQSHLTRLFHRIVGMSPASWRRSRQNHLSA